MSTWLSFPKVELHCHLLGVINPCFLEQIRNEGGEILVDPDRLRAAYPVRGVASFQDWVEVLKPYQSAPPEFFRGILARHVERLIEQNVIYTEIMISPMMFYFDAGGFLKSLHRWREWSYEMERGKIQIEFLASVPRSIGADALERDTAAFIRMKREQLIAGVALVGVETGESIRRFGESFARWRDAGLGIEIHAGENTGPEAVRDALEYGRPQRLGHAISAFQDPKLTEDIRAQNVHIEFCPKSNVSMGAVESLSAHTMKRAPELGIRFGINTDDPGAFECSLETEYSSVAEEFHFGEDDFLKIFKNSLAARFEPKLRYYVSEINAIH